MTSTATRTQDQILADLRTVGKLPVVYAVNMLHAQGFQLSPELRSQMVSRADLFRELFETTDKQGLNLTVRHPHSDEVLGTLAFRM